MIHYISTQGVGQPWVANELRVVGKADIPFVLHAMRAPQHDLFTSDWARRMDEDTRVLYPLPVFRAALAGLLAPLRFGGRFWKALGNALFSERESLRIRTTLLVHLFVACHWAQELRSGKVSHIHAQWAHSSASIGMYGAWLLGVPFSFTGHATDLFRHRCGLRDKIRRAEFIVCISEFHREFFLSEGALPEQLEIVYCGIDVAQFAPPEIRGPARNPRGAGEGVIAGRRAEHPPRPGVAGRTPRAPTAVPTILSAGRLVEKKGFTDLIQAARILRDRGIDFRCVIRGTGPLEVDLAAEIQRQSVGEFVELVPSAVTQEAIPEFMAHGDVFCLACVWATDDDVDGLPQLLMEAMACGVPAVSTRLVGIPDLVEDELTGLLAEPNAPDQLADCLQRVLSDRELASRLGDAGRARVVRVFDIDKCLEPLLSRYRQRLGMTHASVPTTSTHRSPQTSVRG